MALAGTHALRGYEAVQLASVLEANAQRLTLGAPPLALIAADHDLLAAGVASKEGDGYGHHRLRL